MGLRAGCVRVAALRPGAAPATAEDPEDADWLGPRERGRSPGGGVAPGWAGEGWRGGLWAGSSASRPATQGWRRRSERRHRVRERVAEESLVRTQASVRASPARPRSDPPGALVTGQVGLVPANENPGRAQAPRPRRRRAMSHRRRACRHRSSPTEVGHCPVSLASVGEQADPRPAAGRYPRPAGAGAALDALPRAWRTTSRSSGDVSISRSSNTASPRPAASPSSRAAVRRRASSSRAPGSR